MKKTVVKRRVYRICDGPPKSQLKISCGKLVGDHGQEVYIAGYDEGQSVYIVSESALKKLAILASIAGIG